MINTSEILQTVRMITEEKLDIRTITMGISLYACAHPDAKTLYTNVYDRITRQAADLVRTGEALEREFESVLAELRREHDRVYAEWAASAAELTSVAFWKDYLRRMAAPEA